jgi:hypothetical protein
VSTIDYAARVAKGAALLDKKRPGWEREIDLNRLDIQSGSSCVTAQLSGEGHWCSGMDMLGLTAGDDGTYVTHGFNAEEDPDVYGFGDGGWAVVRARQTAAFRTLNTLWRDLIESRLNGAPAGAQQD